MRFWMVDIRREGRCQKSALQKRHNVHLTGVPGKWGWDCGRNKAHCIRGELSELLLKLLVVSSSSWLSELLRRGRHKPQAQPSLGLCAVPKNLNLSGLGLGSERNSGHTLCRADWSLSSVDGESTHAVSWGKPSVVGTLWVLTTHASDICLHCPSLPTAPLNNRT